MRWGSEPQEMKQERKKDGKGKQGNLSRRLAMYTAGLFVMTVGIALSVKSRLGVSPISSIPLCHDVHLGH